MDHKLTHRFAELLEQQSNSDPEAVWKLHKLQVAQTHGQCLFDLYGEWRSAFSYSPGRIEALEPLLALARWLLKGNGVYVNRVAEREEWAQLVNLRGPVEMVLSRKCKNCRTEIVSMGTSGFYDADGLVCGDCGNVFFKSYYHAAEPPSCPCGGIYKHTWPCPVCGHDEYVQNGPDVSPYEYFATHFFTRGSFA